MCAVHACAVVVIHSSSVSHAMRTRTGMGGVASVNLGGMGVSFRVGTALAMRWSQDSTSMGGVCTGAYEQRLRICAWTERTRPRREGLVGRWLCDRTAPTQLQWPGGGGA